MLFGIALLACNTMKYPGRKWAVMGKEIMKLLPWHRARRSTAR